MKTAYFVIAALALATAGAAIGAEQSAATVTASAATTAAAAASTATAKRGLTREEVRAQTIAARQNGTLAETEADSDIANIARAAR